VVRVSDGRSVAMPAGLHPFWLHAEPSGAILAAAEGDDEDSDPGAVLRLEPPDYGVRVLLQVTDPDQVLTAGGRIFVAAHGAREVDVLTSSGARAAWARGAAAVALAADEPQRTLLVVTNERE
jgi:hypothetical protein